MATKRSTFQKRQRETDLKDKARAKEARRAAKRDATGGQDQQALAEAARQQEAAIAAAIAEATAASATIARDSQRAANAPSSLSDNPLPAPAPAEAPPARRNQK